MSYVETLKCDNTECGRTEASNKGFRLYPWYALNVNVLNSAVKGPDTPPAGGPLHFCTWRCVQVWARDL